MLQRSWPVCSFLSRKEYSSLGCWKLNAKNADENALADLNDDSPISDYPPNTESLVSKCAKLAKKHGYSYFGIRNHFQCVSGVHAGFTYYKYGLSSNCSDGTGGPGAMDVYSLEGKMIRRSINLNWQFLYIFCQLCHPQYFYFKLWRFYKI